MTGLSDTMSPGSISRLAQSADIAFRARFSTTPPAKQKLYWRGPVMEQFDGHDLAAARQPGNVATTGNAVSTAPATK